MPLWTRIPSWLDIEAYAERLFSKRGLGATFVGFPPLGTALESEPVIR
ncbi:hypothetical protein SAMN05216604_1441 [Pseudomonas agarici]|nr:hypothetical protein SAMN05216604_1441 [Pseudomonas agarici]